MINVVVEFVILADWQEVEVSQMTQELKDLRRIRDEGIRKAKLLKYNIDELEVNKGVDQTIYRGEKGWNNIQGCGQKGILMSMQ